MKKLINNVSDVLAESLNGFVSAHADIVALGAEHKFVQRKVLKPGKVALLSGGGSGHEPLHAGFVGHGMLDAACPGPGLHLANTRPDDRRRRCGGYRRWRALHRQEL